MSSFSIEHIDSYSQKIKYYCFIKVEKVKKHFCRGQQLLEENFIDIASIYSKQSDTLFCLKEVRVASLKNRTVGLLWHCLKFMTMIRQCPAEKVGTSSHMFSVMKLVAKWAIDKLIKI